MGQFVFRRMDLPRSEVFPQNRNDVPRFEISAVIRFLLQANPREIKLGSIEIKPLNHQRILTKEQAARMVLLKK